MTHTHAGRAGFAGARVAEQAQGMALTHPARIGEGADHLGADGRVGGVVEVLKTFRPGEAGFVDQAQLAPPGPFSGLGFEQVGQEPLVAGLLA